MSLSSIILVTTWQITPKKKKIETQTLYRWDCTVENDLNKIINIIYINKIHIKSNK